MAMQAVPGAPSADDTQHDEGAGVAPSTAVPRDEMGEVEQRQVNAVEAYARGHADLTEENERDALDWLLGPRPPMQFDVEVEYDTPEGRKPLVFVVHALDPDKLEAVEQRNVNSATGRVNMNEVHAQVVAEACVGVMGKKGAEPVPLTAPEFRTMQMRNRETGEIVDQTWPSASEALKARFRTQFGLVVGVANEVRMLSGYDPARVKDARRRLVAAAGN